jgi:hypothetical protein
MSRRGHSPVIATLPVYRNLVEAGGIALFCSPGHRRQRPRHPSPRDGPAHGKPLHHLRRDADLIVTHPITVAALLLARKGSIPWAAVALSPVSLYSIYDPPVLSGLPFAEKLTAFGPTFQRGLRKTVGFLFEPLWKPFRQFEIAVPYAPHAAVFPRASVIVCWKSRRGEDQAHIEWVPKKKEPLTQPLFLENATRDTDGFAGEIFGVGRSKINRRRRNVVRLADASKR